MLATLTHDYFNDESWIYERKLDGERALIFSKNKDISIMSRNEKTLNFRYPEIINFFKKTDLNFVLDGEIVAFDKKLTSFEKLQERIHVSTREEAKKSKVKIYYYIFDIIFFNGFDLSKLNLISRKQILKKSLKFKDPIRYLNYRRKNGLKYYKEACKKGWEGIIAKYSKSNYVHSRSKKWLKFKCVKQQEFIIIGYTDPKGSRVGFGALLLGYYKNGKLRYAGEVGTGFDDESLKFLKNKFNKIKIDSTPLDKSVDIGTEEVHWLEPRLVCEVGFTEWTKHNKLRHPRYKGLREDKNPKDVVKEE